MKNLLKLLVGIGSIFFSTYVSYKIYGWYSPEVGFELPKLSYLNIFAIQMLTMMFTSIFRIKMMSDLYSKFIPKEDRKYNFLTIPFTNLLILGVMYLIHIIIF